MTDPTVKRGCMTCEKREQLLFNALSEAVDRFAPMQFNTDSGLRICQGCGKFTAGVHWPWCIWVKCCRTLVEVAKGRPDLTYHPGPLVIGRQLAELESMLARQEKEANEPSNQKTESSEVGPA